MTIGWTAFIQKGPPQKNNSKQLETHYVSTYDVENTNGTNNGRYLFLANKLQIVR